MYKKISVLLFVFCLFCQACCTPIKTYAATNAVVYDQVYINDNRIIKEYLTADLFIEDTGYNPGDNYNYTNMVVPKGTYVGKTTICVVIGRTASECSNVYYENINYGTTWGNELDSYITVSPVGEIYAKRCVSNNRDMKKWQYISTDPEVKKVYVGTSNLAVNITLPKANPQIGYLKNWYPREYTGVDGNDKKSFTISSSGVKFCSDNTFEFTINKSGIPNLGYTINLDDGYVKQYDKTNQSAGSVMIQYDYQLTDTFNLCTDKRSTRIYSPTTVHVEAEWRLKNKNYSSTFAATARFVIVSGKNRPKTYTSIFTTNKLTFSY